MEQQHHHHDHGCSCACGHDHHHAGHEQPAAPAEGLSQNQTDFLHQLSHSHYLPLARFAVESSVEGDYYAVALSPVFLRSAGDDMDAVREAGAFLTKLAELGMITLDYEIPLSGYSYEEYHNSALYAYFKETVAQAAGKPGFLGDTPVLELGSMALTQAGEKAAGCGCKA